MEQIYHSKHFGHIDLAKIITISDARWFDAGQSIGFNIRVLGQDEPLTYMRSLNDKERRWIPQVGHGNEDRGRYWEVLTVKGEYKRFLRINTGNDYTVAEENLQEELDDFVNAWKSYCTAHAVSHLPSSWTSNNRD